MKVSLYNRQVIKRIAIALGELNDQVVFVGGATVSLYTNDTAAEDVRPTKDIDISLSIATLTELEKIRNILYDKGFIQSSEDDVICRFRYAELIVDFMNTKAIGWAPANPWFPPGFALKEAVEIEGKTIQILPLPYFLASKFSAFNNRGNKEPRTSHDFEDIVYILDNKKGFSKNLLEAPEDVKLFLKIEFEKILNDKEKQEAILGNLFYAGRDERFMNIMHQITAFLELT